jgi:hypothetical protein
VNHTFMVNNEVVIAQTQHFLLHGAFLHEEPATQGMSLRY